MTTVKIAYSLDYEPPCPVLTLRVASPVGQGIGIAFPAVVDTGADMTLIPEGLARTLDLPMVSQIRVAGITGNAETAGVHAAALELSGRSFLAELVAFGDEAIVGRDLLNRLVIELNGPAKTLEIRAGRPSTRKRSR